MSEKRPRMKHPQPLAALLEAVFAGKPAEKRMRESRVWLVWDETVGSQIAAKAQPASFRDGTLVVRVSGSAWLQQLSLMKQEIIHQLNTAVGEPLVRDIFLKQGGLHPLQEAKEPPPPKRKLTAAEKRQLGELTEAIADQELRAAFMSLFSSQLADAPRKSNH